MPFGRRMGGWREITDSEISGREQGFGGCFGGGLDAS